MSYLSTVSDVYLCVDYAYTHIRMNSDGTGYGTGFIGEITISGKYSIVLVTNYHIMINGLDETYEKATSVTESMKKKIEENARKCAIKLEGGKRICLSKLLVKGSCIVSPITSVSIIVSKDYMYVANYYVCLHIIM